MSLKIYDIEAGKFAEEKICAESFMRFLYRNPLGAAALCGVFKRAFFSRACGVWANSKASRKAIVKFAADNGIDLSESRNPPVSFRCFNDFFTRELRSDARPLAEGENPRAVSFPSDGRHLLLENVSEADVFYAKGQRFNLAKFLGDAKLAERFSGGAMLISRLSPLDYHRFHFPVSGEIAARKTINGDLFSVSPIALAPRLSILWENKRILNIIGSREFGMCAFVEIGATNVGTIINLAEIGSRAERGAQAGYFKLGASCVATLFESSAKIDWNAELVRMSRDGIECYARANTLAGVLLK